MCAQNMPKRVKPLTDIEVKKKTEDGMYAVGLVPGLNLYIRNGFKHWYLRYNYNKQSKSMSIGEYPLYSLKEAREKATELRKLLNQGIDPQAFRDDERRRHLELIQNEILNSLTFKKAVEQYVEFKDGYDPFPDRDRDMYLARMRKYVYPRIGNKPIKKITQDDIVQVLFPLWTEQHSLAKKVRQVINKTFVWHKAKGNVEVNPVDNQVLLQLLPKLPEQEINHHAMLPIEDMPRFMKLLREQKAVSARCLEFMILTASRSGNARLAEWNEIHWDKKLWIIPARKMKVSKNGDHVVPLSDQAFKLLEKVKASTVHKNRYIFVGSSGRSNFSDGTFRSLIARMNKKNIANGGEPFVDEKELDSQGNPSLATPHGLARATFRTWAQNDELGNDKRFSDRVAELCLHHNVSDAYRGAYERNEAMKSRTEMMQAWADYCYGEENGKNK